MNASAHQVTDRFMDEAMALDRIVAGEGGGAYGDFVMAAVPGTGVPGMAVRFVLDVKRLRCQRRQAFAQQGCGFGAHAGRTFLNGLTVTFS